MPKKRYQSFFSDPPTPGKNSWICAWYYHKANSVGCTCSSLPTSVRGRKSKSRFLWRCSRAILYRELVSFHANPWKGDSSWADYRGRGEARSSDPPPPPKITKNRVSKHTSPVPLKITKLPSQHSMLGHQSAKHQFNGVSLAGQWWPAFVVFGSSLPSSTKKTSKLDPTPSPGQNFLAG